MKRCKYCKKILKKLNGKKLNPRREYCNGVCRNRYNTKKNYHNKYKFNKKRIKRERKRFKEWYENNKSKYKEYAKKSYSKNKDRWDERRFINERRDIFLGFIPHKCKNCDKPKIEIISIKVYGKQPKLFKGKNMMEKNLKILEDYSKNLLGFCSLKCSKEYMMSLKNVVK